MWTVNHGGLGGKARRARGKSRAAKLYVRQCVDEYLRPDANDGGPAPYVPIRHSAEFSASVDVHPDNERRRDAQMELHLVPGRADGPSRFAQPTGKAKEPRIAANPVPATSTDAGKAVASVAKLRESASALFSRVGLKKPQWRTKSNAQITAGGFLWGCALGSAAAAMVLLVLHTALR